MKISVLVSVAGLLATLVSSASVSAQPRPVAPGERVRVVRTEGSVVIGALVSYSPAGVVVLTPDTEQPVVVPADAVHRVDVSDGMGYGDVDVAVGLFALTTMAGGLIGYLTWNEPECLRLDLFGGSKARGCLDDGGGDGRGRAALNDAVAVLPFAAAGSVLYWVLGHERWRPGTPGPSPDGPVTLVPVVGHGGAGVALRMHLRGP